MRAGVDVYDRTCMHAFLCMYVSMYLCMYVCKYPSDVGVCVCIGGGGAWEC